MADGGFPFHRPSPDTPVPVRRLVLSPPGGLVCSGVLTVPRSKRSRYDGDRAKWEENDDERTAIDTSSHVLSFGMESSDECGLYIIRLAHPIYICALLGMSIGSDIPQTLHSLHADETILR
jgi:hypothetical protein